MKNAIIGTAGHIDHGKTTLIKALTGRNTDKLPEEIKRGISINLGFTYFNLPSGKRAGIIDVPGHERFIKNMIAGAAGIDIVLLVIAANEGVKPQTIEHIDILSYLKIKESLIVLTKSSLADEEFRELVKEDIREKLNGTFLEDSEIIEVDSLSGEGIDNLVQKIESLLERPSIVSNENIAARLNVDRVFSMKGFGSVVTGTLEEGKISVGDELYVYPKNLIAKIRGVQVHEESVQSACAGQRTALNIGNLRASDLERGDVIAFKGSMVETKMLDVKVKAVSHYERGIRLWDRVRVYMGCREILARIIPLDKEIIRAGEEAYCQLRLEETAAVKKDDKFVLRYYSPMTTIGGGIIVDPKPPKHTKMSSELIETLKVKEQGDISIVIEKYLEDRKEKGASEREIADYCKISMKEAQKNLDAIIKDNSALFINGFYYASTIIEAFKTKLIETLNRFHNQFTLKKGISKEELRSKMSTAFKLKEFDFLLKILEAEKVITISWATTVSLYGFVIVYDERQKKIKSEIESGLKKAGFSPTLIESVTRNNKEYATVLESLYDDTVIKLDDQNMIHKEYYDIAVSKTLETIEKTGEITLAQFRDFTNSSRKYSLIILEYFDKIKLTKRVGDKRVKY